MFGMSDRVCGGRGRTHTCGSNPEPLLGTRMPRQIEETLLRRPVQT
jgi:hypothetical protein